jgi:rfaE bifunctional protein kinase chain/domain
MNSADPNDLSALLSAPPSVLVIGDCMLDVYLEGAVHRISPEAPVPVLQLHRQSQRAGGAANVALNLAQLRCPCTLTGLVGTDTAGACLVSLLDQPGITQNHVRSPAVHTTQKIRMVSQRQQLLRMDVEAEPPPDCVDALATLARELATRHRWVLLSDYGKGALGAAADLQALLAQCRAQRIPRAGRSQAQGPVRLRRRLAAQAQRGRAA